jgi:regulator of cell morphogenesis and NO signaling
MVTPDLDACNTIVQWAARHPQVLDFLEESGQECCDEAHQSLQELCWRRSVDVSAVCLKLSIEACPALQISDCWDMSLSQVCDYVEGSHHAFIRDDLARGARIVDRILRKHGDETPRVALLAEGFTRLRDRIMNHLFLEQSLIFPGIRRMEQTGSLPRLVGAAMDHPICVLEREHRVFEEVLRQLLELGNDAAAQVGHCADYVGVIRTIQRLIVVMQRSDQLEGRFLFRRALELETRLMQCG